jgi:hypothetical protein
MQQMIYSAGLMTQLFWFLEFKKAVRLYREGMSLAEIKKKCVEENLFGTAREHRALRMSGYIVNRLKLMDSQLLELFCTSDLATQKLINLVTILRNDRLFFEFIYEVYREKVIMGVTELTEADVNIFFSQKETQSELVAGWKDSTKRHLKSDYLNFMAEANLLTVIEKKRMITPPIMDVALERYLIASGEEAMVKALTGVN